MGDLPRGYLEVKELEGTLPRLLDSLTGQDPGQQAAEIHLEPAARERDVKGEARFSSSPALLPQRQLQGLQRTTDSSDLTQRSPRRN